MTETLIIPDDLETCQQLLRERWEAHRRLREVHAERLATCTSMQDSQEKLEQEKERLEETVKSLMHRLYGRRSERLPNSPDQLPLDFGDGELIEVVPDLSEDETFVEEHQQKRRRRRRKKPLSGRFPEHLPRRTERIEPELPEGIRREDCELIGVDVVEILDFDRPNLWVRRLEYRALYDIEERGSRLDDVARLLLRRRESVPLMRQLETLLDGPLARGLLPKSKLGTALGYLRNHWDALTRFLSDGRLPIDNNEAERALRRIAVGRKNWLFVGCHEGGERSAVILTVIASAHRHDLDVWAYLRDILERLAKGETALEPLLPDVWKAAHPQQVRTFREEEREQRAENRRYQAAKRRLESLKS